MTFRQCSYLGTGVLAAFGVCFLAPAQSRPNLNINFPQDAGRCSDVKVGSEGAIARAQETFSLPAGQVSVLRVDSARRGNIRVRGWDRTDYSIEACRIAVSTDQAGADRLLKSISITRGGTEFTNNGPDDGQWTTVFFINAPANASLNLETRNGPISMRSVKGNLKARAVNGPISLQDCSGTVDAQSTNGPIRLDGGSGDVTLTAANGSVTINLAAEVWSGAGLVARTTTGPLTATLPHYLPKLTPAGIVRTRTGQLQAGRLRRRSGGADQRKSGARVEWPEESQGQPVNRHRPDLALGAEG